MFLGKCHASICQYFCIYLLSRQSHKLYATGLIIQRKYDFKKSEDRVIWVPSKRANSYSEEMTSFNPSSFVGAEMCLENIADLKQVHASASLHRWRMWGTETKEQLVQSIFQFHIPTPRMSNCVLHLIKQTHAKNTDLSMIDKKHFQVSPHQS